MEVEDQNLPEISQDVYNSEISAIRVNSLIDDIEDIAYQERNLSLSRVMPEKLEKPNDRSFPTSANIPYSGRHRKAKIHYVYQ